MKNGKRSWCRKCSAKYAISYYHNNSEKINAYCQIQRANDYGRKYHLKRTFNLTPDQYEIMLENQKGGCALCDKTPQEEGRALAVDHCHETEKIRGLLCFQCNSSLIRKHFTPDLLRKAAAYLEKGGF